MKAGRLRDGTRKCEPQRCRIVRVDDIDIVERLKVVADEAHRRLDYGRRILVLRPSPLQRTAPSMALRATRARSARRGPSGRREGRGATRCRQPSPPPGRSKARLCTRGAGCARKTGKRRCLPPPVAGCVLADPLRPACLNASDAYQLWTKTTSGLKGKSGIYVPAVLTYAPTVREL